MGDFSRVIGIWLSGGWVMIPLFGLAVLLYTQAYTLLQFVRRNDLDRRTEREWWQWVRRPEAAEGQVGEVIRFCAEGARTSAELRGRFDEVRANLVAPVDRRQPFVATLVTAAPLLGLLGTVIGMLQTFLGISTSGGAETAGVVASGISEALVTTQTGLTISLPGLFMLVMLQRRRHSLSARLARLESLMLSHAGLD